MSLAVIPHTEYAQSVRRAFDEAGGAHVVSDGRPVLLKPNLVNATPFPVTTSPNFVATVIEIVRDHTDTPIIIAEGCGDAGMETQQIFTALGYTDMAARYDVELIDLNKAELVHKSNPDCTVFPEMWLPELAFSHCIVSLPVIKAHSLATITGTLKNMMGFPPPSHYCVGGWKKSAFHARMQESITDLCAYIMPDFTIMDATVGMAEYHLGGATCQPPINTIIAGTDALELDRTAAKLLNIDWKQVPHLR